MPHAYRFYLFTGQLQSATVVAERLCFHRCLSVHGGRCKPPGRHPPGQADTTLGRHPLPRPDTPWPGRHPPPLARHPPLTDGHCSGRYASYWNAFLYLFCYFLIHDFENSPIDQQSPSTVKSCNTDS